MTQFHESAGFRALLFLLHDGASQPPIQHRRSIMITKIPALITAALILGSTSMASAAVTHHPRRDRVLLLEDSGVYGAPARVVGSYGGYSSNPKTRALELLSDEYPPGW
jgi:hypothetical protein